MPVMYPGQVVRVAGNTAGATADIYNGTVVLAGGTNVTLSQNGNTISIIGATSVAGGGVAGGMSTLGNTLGNTGTISSGTLVFAGGNNITLSQATGAGGATITISGVNTVAQTVQTQNVHNLTLAGNTAGVMAQVSSGTLTLAGGNNVTLSQVGNAVTISGANIPAQTVQTQNLVDVSLSGNIAGVLALVSSGTLVLAGGNNVTLSQNGQSVTISGANIPAQTVQTQNLVDVSLSGNTAGVMALVSSGTLILAGGNNVTLSQNGQSVTISGVNTVAQSVQTQNLIDVTLAGNSTSAGAGFALASSGTLTLAGGNNVTLSQNGNAVTISAANQTVQTQNVVDVLMAGNTAGALTTVSSGTLTLAGGNNITLSQAGNAITISGNNTLGFAVKGGNNTSGGAGFSTVTSGGAFIAGGNNITLSQDGNNITISAANQTVQTQNLVDVSLSGNTAGVMALVSSGTLILAGGNNVTLSQNGQSVTISGVNTVAQSTQTQNLHNLTLAGNSTSAGAGFVQVSSGTLTLAGGNNITLSQNGNAVTISAANQTVQTQNLVDVTLAGNTAGALALVSSGTLTLAGGNNVTLSQAGNAVTVSAANQTVQTQNLHNVTLAGNTAGALAQVSSGTLTFAGGNNITLSQNGNAVTISAFTQTVQTQNLVDVSLSGNTAGVMALVSSGTLNLAGGNNITLSQNGNSVTISGANVAQTVQTQNLVDVSLSGNTAGVLALVSSGTLILAGGNNVTLSQNGQSVTISGANVAQTVQTQNLVDVTVGGNSTSAGGGFALVSSGTLTLAGGNNITLSQNGNAITISAAAGAGGVNVGVSNVGNTSGNTQLFNTGNLVFAGGNNITLSESTAGGGATVTISAANQTVQTQNLIDVTLAGNTSGALALVSSGTLTFAGGNNITLSQAGNAITISGASIPAQTVQTQNLVDVSLSGNTAGALALVSSGTLILAGGNNVTLSQNGQSVTISGPNTQAQTVQTQNLFDLTLGGNSTSGVGGFALVSSGTLTLAGGNNITISQNGGNAITLSAANQTVQTQNLVDVTLAGNSTSAGGGFALVSSGTLTLAGGNNVTLSQNGNAITISGASIPAQTVQTQNLVDVSLSGNTAGALALVSSGTLILAGGNNVTLSQNGQSVTISAANSAAQTVQTQNMVDVTLAGNSTSAGAGFILASSGTLTLAGGNNVTLSQNGNAITISAFNQTVQTQTHNVTLGGNSTSAGAGFVQISTGTLTFAGGNNVTLSQNGNAVTISAANQTVQTQNLVDVSLSGNTAGALALVSSGTLILAGGNNVTLSQNGQSVTISGPNTQAQTVQTQNLIDVTLAGNSTSAGAGFALASSGTLTLAGGNNITLSQNGNAVTISAANQTVQTQNLVDVSLSGNTAGVMALVSSGTLVFAGGNNITLSQNGQSVTISGANTNQTVQTQNVVDVSLSGNTAGVLALVSSGTIILAGGNNVTLSQNAQSVTISAANQTVQTQNLIDVTLAGNSTSAGGGFALISSGTLTLAGGNNVTLSQNGNAITISAFTQTVQTQNLIDVTLAGNSTSAGAGFVLASSGTLTLAGGNNITLSQNGNAVTVSGVSHQQIGMSNLGNTVGTSSVLSTGSLVFAGGNNVTLSQATGANGATITISAFNQTVQTQNLVDVTVGGNSTSAGGGFALVSSGTLTLAGGNNVTLSQNGNAITISAFTQTVQTQTHNVTIGGNSTSAGAGFIQISTGTMLLAGGNNVTLSQNGASITISAFTQTVQTQNLVDVSLSGNTAGVMALVSSGTLNLAGGNNITLSQNGQSVTISGPNTQAQTVQTQNMVDVTIGGNSTSAGAGFVLASSGTLTLAGGNNITLSQNGNAVTVSAANQTVQTQNLHNVTLAGNTTGTLAQVSSGTLTLAGGNNITLSQVGNAVTISAFTQTVQTQNLHNVSLSGNTAGVMAQVSSGTLILAGGNNITLSQNGQSITISGGAGAGGINAGISTLGNTAGITGLIGTGNLVFVGSDNITLNQSVDSAGATISISGGAGGGGAAVGVGTVGNTAGTTGTFNTGTVFFAGGNRITLSQATGTGGATITISGDSQSVQTQNMVDVTVGGNTAGVLALVSSGTLTLAGGNNITLSQVGNAITISGNDTLGFAVKGGNSTSGGAGFSTVTAGGAFIAGGNNITLSQDGNNITISGANSATVLDAISIGGNSTSAGAGYSNISDGTAFLMGGNNITLSQNGASITISGVSHQQIGMSNLGNTSGTSSVLSTGSLVFAGGNNVTLSQATGANGATITISAFTQTVQTQNLVDVTLAGNTAGALALVSSGTLTFAGGNNITLSQAGNAVTISAPNSHIAGISTQGNTAGTTGLVGAGSLLLVGGNLMTLSQSYDGTNATLTMSVNGNLTAAQTNQTVPTYTASLFPFPLPASTATSTYATAVYSIGAGGNSTQMGYSQTLYVQPIVIPGGLVVSRINLMGSITTQAGTGTCTFAYSCGLYTNNANTLSKVGDWYGGMYVTQNSTSAQSYSVWTASTAGATSAVTANPYAGWAASSIQSSAGNGINVNVGNAIKMLRLEGPSVTLTGGNYWLVHALAFHSTSTPPLGCSNFVQANMVSSAPILEAGVATASTLGTLGSGWGVISTAYTSNSNAATWLGLPSAFALSLMSSTNSSSVLRMPLFMMRGGTGL